mgnify:CR=1 FL=1
MIYGALGDIEEYRGMLKGLDVLIDWLEENDPAQLEVGSHPILGEKVFANVMAPTTRPEAEAHYETHQRYHDLQIDVEGREAFKVATGSLTLVQEFDEKDDYDLVDSDARSPAILLTTSLHCSLPASLTCPRSSSRAMARSRSRRFALSCLPTPTGRNSALLG